MKETKKRNLVFLCQLSNPNVVFIMAACKALGLEIKPLLKMSNLWDAWTEYDEMVLISSRIDLSIFEDWFIFLDLAINSIPSSINPLEIQDDDSHVETQKVLNFMKETGFLKHAQDMQNPEKWKENRLAARYGKSLAVATTFFENQNNLTGLWQLFEDAAIEILYGKENKEITTFNHSESRCSDALENALKKVNFETLPLIANEKVAYAYLDNVSPWLNLRKFQKEVLRLNEVLFVLQYRKNNEELTWIGSNNKLNINKIFGIKNNEESPYEALIKRSHKELLSYIFYQIKQFSA
ncbi:hypothetical protein JXE04_03200 [Patescibacteria group bacterium]|nr:hypothetical protein [Patescibacteria group bacterium]